MKGKKLLPELRFPGFEGEWEEKRLGEICDNFKSGQGITAKDIFENGPYPVYGGNGLRGYSQNFTHSGEYVLIGRQGALCGNVNIVNGDNYISEHAIAVRGNKYNNNQFLYFKLDDLKLNRLSESSAQPGLSVEKLIRIKIALPSLPEQQKIADFLSSVDKKIELLENQLKLQEEYKKGMMQKLFSQQIRFKDEYGKDFPDWEEKKLGEIGYSYNGLSGKSGIDFGEGYPFITYKSVFDNSKVDLNRVDFVKISDTELRNKSQNEVSYGDIFFTVSSETPNEVGMASVLLDKVDLCFLNSFCFGFRLHNLDEFSSCFFSYYLRSYQIRKSISILAQGSTRYNISKNEMTKLQLSLPSLPEQQKIADFLSSLDKKIDNTKQQLEKAKDWKKGLMQKLFV